MSVAEPTLEEMCILAAQWCSPLDQEEFLSIAHTLIKGTPKEDKVKAWLKTCKHHDAIEKGQLLIGRYYQSFLERHPNLTTAKGRKKDIHLSIWATSENIIKMYGTVEERLLALNIIGKRPHPVWADQDGEVVRTEEEAHGIQGPYEMIDGERFFMMDKTSRNTNIKREGQVGGK